MRTTVRRFVVICVIGLTSCSSGGGAESTTTTSTTTVPVTTTTLDPAAIREAKKVALLSEVFIDNQGADFNKEHKFFATTEEIQNILRKNGIFGGVELVWAGFDAFTGAQVQRELCDDFLLEDLVARAAPSRTVGRFFTWTASAANYEGSTEGALFAMGGMNIFEVSNGGLADFVADYFAIRGGACELTSLKYQCFDWTSCEQAYSPQPPQWWTEQQVVGAGIEIKRKDDVKLDSRFCSEDCVGGPGFRITQTSGKRCFVRTFRLIEHIELGLLTVIELNVLRNGCGRNSPSIVELAKNFAPAIAELEITMERKLADYLVDW